MATRRESSSHNNPSGHDGKRLNTHSFVLNVKGTVPDKRKQRQMHFDLCWADVLVVQARCHDDRAKSFLFPLLHSVLFITLLILSFIELSEESWVGIVQQDLTAELMSIPSHYK